MKRMSGPELAEIEAGAEWATPRLVYLGGDDFRALVAEIRRCWAVDASEATLTAKGKHVRVAFDGERLHVFPEEDA